MEAGFTVLYLFFFLAAPVFWIWALVDVIRRPSGTLQRGSQLLWALVVPLTDTAGAAAHVLLGRPRVIRSVGR